MPKKAKTNSTRRNLRVAKKKLVVERGLGSRLSEAYRWFSSLLFVYNNFDGIKSLFEHWLK